MPRQTAKSITNFVKSINIDKDQFQQLDLSAFSGDSFVLKLRHGIKLNLIQTASRPNNVQIELGEKSLLNYFVEFKYSDSAINNSITIKLNGAGAEVNLNMVVIGRVQGKAALKVKLEHLAPSTKGRIQIRRLQYDASQSDIKGLLFIGPRGSGTDTYLSDKSLLIGERSQAISVPQLEIKTNNVKASHGAAVGHISPDDLFYLQSRGLSKANAIKYLCQAFIAPALRK
ncbi:MAG: SufD family Fe-S cluster assembly protein [Candidatus Kerfeldbacteria bacterium]|nr:SufD family Fe-S cluster assembly protein [Candidatus Kerfeldbacteria bacterium]